MGEVLETLADEFFDVLEVLHYYSQQFLLAFFTAVFLDGDLAGDFFSATFLELLLLQFFSLKLL